ncbi:MAG: FdtA/QdtA family cupin domain-containing protein [Elusimicrobiota bacterium]|jgi:dTDP-4-dehydrorhamnose 3,5-epimerase-like enzyme|nr:FdtA/QdtA family cupin domain-containing protein [Elusimicrobiota bacterium]
MDYKVLDLKVFGDERGSLISLEEGRNLPFAIKRVYYIYDTKPGVERGKHAHKNLQQLIVCLHGSCSFVLDDGAARREVLLNCPDKALYIGNNIWREMKDFSYGAVLMVLASQTYDDKEYIRDYNEFLREIQK